MTQTAFASQMFRRAVFQKRPVQWGRGARMSYLVPRVGCGATRLDDNKGAIEQPCCTMWFPSPLPPFWFSSKFLICTRCDARRDSLRILTHRSLGWPQPKARSDPCYSFFLFQLSPFPMRHMRPTFFFFLARILRQETRNRKLKELGLFAFSHPTRTFECGG